MRTRRTSTQLEKVKDRRYAIIVAGKDICQGSARAREMAKETRRGDNSSLVNDRNTKEAKREIVKGMVKGLIQKEKESASKDLVGIVVEQDTRQISVGATRV